MIAALFVERDGVYYGLPNVDPWDKERDARKYEGPHPVVAHPPCERWGNFWFGGTQPGSKRYMLGDDGGCFEAALAAVRRWGGVIEHPKGSRAWAHFGLREPPAKGWGYAERVRQLSGGYTCEVEQGAYGHKTRKSTWLYVVGVSPLPRLRWGSAAGEFALMRGYSKRRAIERGVMTPPAIIPRNECAATPPAFRDLLLSIAASSRT